MATIEKYGVRWQLQKSIKLMREKHRRQRNDMRSNLGYWLTLDRQSQRDELTSHQAELKIKQSRSPQRRQQPKKDQGLEP